MPSIEWNRKQWISARTGWNQVGEGWSSSWGGVDMQWYGTILPRIHNYVPAGTILEIACGFGRWTQYLKDCCERLIAVDLVPECVEACNARFADCTHATFYANDGKSLEMVPDSSVDLVFSFDSLVHVDPTVMQAYISQLPRVLSANGVAFLHHSNLGEYGYYRLVERVPKLRGALGRLGILERNLHNRDRTVSGQLVRGVVENAGLKCISQEMVPWSTRSSLIDCFTVIVRPSNQSFPQNLKMIRNKAFMEEVSRCAMLAPLYGGSDVR
jgi:ubiquinone/menaquinone biosynthesis C-methylase UbiE